MVYFFDSSGIVKRYVVETGSERVIELTRPEAKHDIYLARIAGVEVVAALTRLVRMGQITAEDANTAIEQFRFDFLQQYQIIEITSGLVERAMDLAKKYSLRGYDATHLAAVVEMQNAALALEMLAPVLISSDLELNKAANAEKITVENPSDQEAENSR